jgi:hypothetical protein
MAINFYSGQTFNGAGCLAYSGNPVPGYYGTSGLNGNQPDFSQWIITAGLYDQSGNLLYSFQVTNLANIAYPATNGTYTVFAPSGDTAQWPVGKAQVLVQATSSGGIELSVIQCSISNDRSLIVLTLDKRKRR